MRTAPVPDIPPIPGMNPGVVVAGGGGGEGGDGGGDGSAGDGNAGAGNENGGQNADGGSNNANGCGQGNGVGNGCPNSAHGSGGTGGTTAGDPIDVLTGKVFTPPSLDLGLPGPLPLMIARMYSSSAADRDIGLGYGWTHSFAWAIEVSGANITIYKQDGTRVEVPSVRVGDRRPIVDDLILRREAWGFGLTLADGRFLLFAEPERVGRVYRLTAIYDRQCNFISLHYDEQGLVELRDAVNRAVRVRRDGQRIRAFDVKSGEHQGRWITFWTYAYDECGDLVTAIDAEGHAVRYTYVDHRLTSQRYRGGLTVHYRYDQSALCVETWAAYPGGKDPSLALDVPDVLADGTRAKGILHAKVTARTKGYVEVADSLRVRRIESNRFGKANQIVAGGGVHSQSFDALGQLTSYTDPLGATTRYKRDSAGRIACVIDPIGRATQYTYDWRGAARKIIMPDGKALRFERDAAANITSIDDEMGNVVEYRYDARGLLTCATLPNGGVTTFEYDEHGNRVAVIEPSGATKRLTYDYLGRVLSVVDALGHATRFAYNDRGLLVAVYLPDGGVRRYTYDANAHLVRAYDADGRATDLVWGGIDALCEVRRGAVSTKMRYNREEQFVELENARGEHHRFVRNMAGHIAREETLDGRISTLRRDGLGRLVQRRSASGDLTEFEYDAAGQLRARRYADDTADEIECDPIGRVTAARSPQVEIRYDYDSRGQCLREGQVVDGVAHFVEKEYDVIGKVVGMRTSLGHEESMEHDIMGRLRRIHLDGRDVAAFERDILGREVASVLPAGGRIEYAYDPMARLVGRRVTSPRGPRASDEVPQWVGTPPAGEVDARYVYSPEGELRFEHDARAGATELSYDPLGQLLARLSPRAEPELFQHDRAGNLFDVSAGAPARSYGPGGRLLSMGASSYVYDDAGRLIEKRTTRVDGTQAVWRYEWTARGLLAEVTSPDGVVTEFVYDAFARRVLKQSRTLDGVLVQRTRFIWNGNSLIQELIQQARVDGESVVEHRTYVFPDGSVVPLGHRDGSEAEWCFYVTDPAGFPEALVSASGSEIARIEHNAYGGALRGGDATPLRHPGQYEDVETGLFYNHYRYFDPNTGRYISADPIETDGGTNLYTYANNSPSTQLDIDGLQAITTISGGGIRSTDVSQSGRPTDPAKQSSIHPTVWNNMPPRVPTDGSPLYPKGNQNPAGCAEATALSNRLYQYEYDHGLPPGTCGSDKDKENSHLRAALAGVSRIESHDAEGNPIPACPNCGALLRNLQDHANAGAGPNDPKVNLVGAAQAGTGIDPSVHPDYDPAKATKPAADDARQGRLRVQPPGTLPAPASPPPAGAGLTPNPSRWT